MFCRKCGAPNPDEAQACSACRQSLAEVPAPVSVVPPQAPPVGTVYAGPTQSVGEPLDEPQTSGKAIASLVLAVLPCVPFGAIIAVVLGHISRSEIRNSRGRLKGDGLALAGLILGYLEIAVIPILIIAAIAIPNLLRARMAANEASAAGSMRTVIIAESNYSAAHQDTGYACDLTTLGEAGLIDTTLANGVKSGYRFHLECMPEGFRLEANPVRRGSTGTRAFCADQTGVIHYDTSGATADCNDESSVLQ